MLANFSVSSADSSAVVQNKQIKNKKQWDFKFLLPRVLILLVVIGVVAILWGLFGSNLSGSAGKTLAPNENSGILISSQLYNNARIAEVKSEPSIGLGPAELAIAEGAELAPLTNNYFATEGENDLLVDELAVGNIIAMSSGWVDFVNDGEDGVFAYISEGSPAAEKLREKANGAQVAYHQLSIGNIMTDGKAYYVPVSEDYTLAANGAIARQTETVVYKLVKSDKKLLVSDWQVV